MNDLKFVQKCIKGDKESWDQFVEKYSRLIYNYIHGVFKAKGHSFSQGNIADLFQEIFLSLTQDNFKRLRSFKAKNGCSLASWLRQVTINRTIDYLRRLQPALSLDEENEEGFSLKDTLVDGSIGAVDAVSRKEKLAHLTDCIKRLGNDDKYFLELHLNRGLSLQELKLHFRASRGAIDMRKKRIVERLRECFKGKGVLLGPDL